MAEAAELEFLNNIHIFEDSQTYEEELDKGTIQTNDLVLLRDNSEFGDAAGLDIMRDGINPDLLIPENLLKGTPILTEDNQRPYSAKTAVTPIVASNKTVTLDLATDYRQFKYLVFLVADTHTTFEPTLLVVPVRRIQNRQKLYDDYITSATMTTAVRSGEIVIPFSVNRWISIACFNTVVASPISTPGSQIKVRTVEYGAVYAIYGANVLE